MILKPSEIIPNNIAYSAGEGINISWKNNGDVLKAYEVFVENNSTGIQVYTSGKVIGYSGKHTIPKNTLINGVVYRFKIKVFNVNDEYAISDYKIFSCYSKPVVNIPNDGFVRNQILAVSATYNQAEDLLLNAYKFTLYDEYENILEESDYLYDGLLSYEFNFKLTNGDVYKVECVAITVNGIYGSSGKISLLAQYEAPTVYFRMQTSVPYNECYVELAWSTVRIIGETSNSPIYINNELIDLSNDILKYDNGFVLPNDFTLRVWIKNIKENVNFLELNGINGTIIMKYYDNKIHVIKQVGNLRMHIVSSILNISSDSMIYVCLQQINEIYMNIFTEVLDG